MFNKPLSQIEFSDVEAFCGEFGEGVRVEYKREMIKEIAKAISAFANTLGGIIIIGVEADEQNRVTAINGIDKKAGIEEGIINSSLNGIYPAVMPEVRIFDVPEKEDKVIVVIKVHESIQAPHAIQNSTRCYIRTGSVSQPYEFAEMDRIEYMLKRREKPEKLKEELRERAYVRFKGLLGSSRVNNPCFYISVSPVFPYQPLTSLDELFVFCNDVPYPAPVGWFNNPDRITDGICKSYGGPDYFDHREINYYGLVFGGELLEETKYKRRDETEGLSVRFSHMVILTGKRLKLAEMFYNKCGYLGSVEIKIGIENIASKYLLYNEEAFPFPDDYKARDNTTYSSKIITAEEIGPKLLEIVTSLLQRILWVFNCDVSNPQLRVQALLSANKLIEKKT